MDNIFTSESGLFKTPSDLTDEGHQLAVENIRSLGHTGTDEQIEASLGQIEADLRAFDATLAVMVGGSQEEKLEVFDLLLSSDNAPALAGLVIAGLTRTMQALGELGLLRSELEALRAAEGLKARPAPSETTRFA